MDSRRKKSNVPEASPEQLNQLKDNSKLQRKLGVHVEDNKNGRKKGSKSKPKVKNLKKPKPRKTNRIMPRTRTQTVTGLSLSQLTGDNNNNKDNNNNNNNNNNSSNDNKRNERSISVSPSPPKQQMNQSSFSPQPRNNENARQRSRPKTPSNGDLSGAIKPRSKSETVRNKRQLIGAPRVQKLVQWFEKHKKDSHHKKVEVMGRDWRPKLNIIMDDKELCNALESHLTQIHCAENVQFLKAVRHFRAHMNSIQQQLLIATIQAKNNQQNNLNTNNNNNNSNNDDNNNSSVKANTNDNNNNNNNNNNNPTNDGMVEASDDAVFMPLKGRSFHNSTQSQSFGITRRSQSNSNNNNNHIHGNHKLYNSETLLDNNNNNNNNHFDNDTMIMSPQSFGGIGNNNNNNIICENLIDESTGNENTDNHDGSNNIIEFELMSPRKIAIERIDNSQQGTPDTLDTNNSRPTSAGNDGSRKRQSGKKYNSNNISNMQSPRSFVSSQNSTNQYHKVISNYSPVNHNIMNTSMLSPTATAEMGSLTLTSDMEHDGHDGHDAHDGTPSAYHTVSTTTTPQQQQQQQQHHHRQQQQQLHQLQQHQQQQQQHGNNGTAHRGQNNLNALTKQANELIVQSTTEVTRDPTPDLEAFHSNHSNTSTKDATYAPTERDRFNSNGSSELNMNDNLTRARSDDSNKSNHSNSMTTRLNNNNNNEDCKEDKNTKLNNNDSKMVNGTNNNGNTNNNGQNNDARLSLSIKDIPESFIMSLQSPNNTIRPLIARNTVQSPPDKSFNLNNTGGGSNDDNKITNINPNSNHILSTIFGNNVNSNNSSTQNDISSIFDSANNNMRRSTSTAFNYGVFSTMHSGSFSGSGSGSGGGNNTASQRSKTLNDFFHSRGISNSQISHTSHASDQSIHSVYDGIEVDFHYDEEFVNTLIKNIFDTFISDKGSRMVNISHGCRVDLERSYKNYSQRTITQKAIMFDTAQREIETLVKSSCLSSFYDSSHFVPIAMSRPKNMPILKKKDYMKNSDEDDDETDDTTNDDEYSFGTLSDNNGRRNNNSNSLVESKKNKMNNNNNNDVYHSESARGSKKASSKNKKDKKRKDKLKRNKSNETDNHDNNNNNDMVPQTLQKSKSFNYGILSKSHQQLPMTHGNNGNNTNSTNSTNTNGNNNNNNNNNKKKKKIEKFDKNKLKKLKIENHRSAYSNEMTPIENERKNKKSKKKHKSKKSKANSNKFGLKSKDKSKTSFASLKYGSNNNTHNNKQGTKYELLSPSLPNGFHTDNEADTRLYDDDIETPQMQLMSKSQSLANSPYVSKSNENTYVAALKSSKNNNNNNNNNNNKNDLNSKQKALQYRKRELPKSFTSPLYSFAAKDILSDDIASHDMNNNDNTMRKQKHGTKVAIERTSETPRDSRNRADSTVFQLVNAFENKAATSSSSPNDKHNIKTPRRRNGKSKTARSDNKNNGKKMAFRNRREQKYDKNNKNKGINNTGDNNNNNSNNNNNDNNKGKHNGAYSVNDSSQLIKEFKNGYGKVNIVRRSGTPTPGMTNNININNNNTNNNNNTLIFTPNTGDDNDSEEDTTTQMVIYDETPSVIDNSKANNDNKMSLITSSFLNTNGYSDDDDDDDEEDDDDNDDSSHVANDNDNSESGFFGTPMESDSDSDSDSDSSGSSDDSGDDSDCKIATQDDINLSQKQRSLFFGSDNDNNKKRRETPQSVPNRKRNQEKSLSPDLIKNYNKNKNNNHNHNHNHNISKTPSAHQLLMAPTTDNDHTVLVDNVTTVPLKAGSTSPKKYHSYKYKHNHNNNHNNHHNNNRKSSPRRMFAFKYSKK